MQTTGFPREEDLIPLLICWCLTSILVWNVLLSLSNVSWPLSFRRAVKSWFEKSEKDRSGSARLPRDLHPRRGKSTFGEDRCRERVIYELQLSLSKPSIISDDVDEHFLQEALKGMCIQKLPPKNPKTTVEDWQENCDAFGMAEVTTTVASVEDESQMENISIGHSTDGVEVKMNTVDVAEEPECEALAEETNRVQRSIHPENSSKGAVTFAEALAILSSRDTDRSKEKFSNDDAVGGVNWNGSRDEREEYAENARDRKNGVDVPPHEDEDDPQHKFGTHLEIGKGNPNENLGKYPMDLKMKIEDRPETRASRSMIESFSIFVFREDDESETGSNEYSSEKIINFEAGASKGAVHLPGNELTEGQEGKDREISSFEDESHSEMTVDGSAERLSSSREDTEICSQKEGDYLGEQFGILPEKGANCTEEKSMMHSGKNATQSREEKKEKDGLGPPPAAGCLKNGHETESSISLLLPVPISHGKEEEDLNAIIRRMIIIEVRKHRKKEQAILKKAHSDTETIVLNKENSTRNRTGLLNLRGRMLFRDLLELEKSLRNMPEGKPDEPREDKSDGNVVKRDYLTNQNASPIKNDVDDYDTVVDDPVRADNSQSLLEIVLTGDSDILLERKVNLPRLSGAEEEKLADAGRAASKPQYACKSTQTEHVYVIRSVKSCPLRKKRLPLQLHRLALDCDPVCSKTVHANRDFSECIFRKASDNLIYEKGKGSLSPSYVPVPERFRWRYLTPNAVR